MGLGCNLGLLNPIQSFGGHFKFVVLLLRCRGRGRVGVKVRSGSGSGTQQGFVSQPSIAKSEFFPKEICSSTAPDSVTTINLKKRVFTITLKTRLCSHRLGRLGNAREHNQICHVSLAEPHLLLSERQMATSLCISHHLA